ncbi:MAG: NUDIX domain-containing protein [Spirochaetaceae bacterium]
MILKYEINEFGGAVIDSEILETDAKTFKLNLEETIQELSNDTARLIWLFLPTSKANLISAAVDSGFLFHHADENGLLLTLKLVKDAFVPGYATHYIGAGGVVIDDQNRILVIHERFHKIKTYKLPGGALDPGEHISDAVVREVFEETGITTEFISVNSFRHWHGYRYGKSDIYFTCMLKPLSSEIIIDPSEISKAIWMPVDELLSDANTHIFVKKIVENALQTDGLKIEHIPNYKSPLTHELMF